ncbi:MAG: protein phosphatase 2C domain-containing protein [Kangiellaceae bacterium]|nr:protein phosphatase 2C domain-containing protein [Kangiellaceae bacterium]
MSNLNPTFEFQSISDCGAFRSNNEDAIEYGIECNNHLAWMVVADGMGGHLAGEVASHMFVDELKQAIKKIKTPESIDWLCWLEIEINRANNKIFISSLKNRQQKGMGTTGVVAIVVDSNCYIGWVGDSRCYLYEPKNSDQVLTQLTVDHSMIQVLLDKGAITEKEAKNANNKNMLSKAIGIKKGVDVDTKTVALHKPVALMLSTDGLHDSLSTGILSFSLEKIFNGKDVTNELIEKAIEGGSKDNITYGSIVIHQ